MAKKNALAGMTKRERKLHARITDAIVEKMGDVVMDATMFGAANKSALMTLEIHELLEADKIQFVHIDTEHSNQNEADGKGCHVKEIEIDDEPVKVLCIPPDVDYTEWRAVYDELNK
jgi:hypothetical protein